MLQNGRPYGWGWERNLARISEGGRRSKLAPARWIGDTESIAVVKLEWGARAAVSGTCQSGVVAPHSKEGFIRKIIMNFGLVEEFLLANTNRNAMKGAPVALPSQPLLR
jgi:hypothetical protein